jgi:hypothetical protein
MPQLYNNNPAAQLTRQGDKNGDFEWGRRQDIEMFLENCEGLLLNQMHLMFSSVGNRQFM